MLQCVLGGCLRAIFMIIMVKFAKIFFEGENLSFHMRTILGIIAVLLMFSCSKAHDAMTASPPAETPTSLSDLAWKMRNDGLPADSFLAQQMHAVELMRRGAETSDPVMVLDQMGFFYNIVGDYTSAMKYYSEAGDSLAHQAIDKRGEGAVMHFGNVSSLYSLLGMFDEALAYSDSAIAESRRQNGLMLSDVYRFRAGIYQMMGDFKKANACYDKALDAINNGNTRADKDKLRAVVYGEKAYAMMQLYPNEPDSVDWVVNTIERIEERYPEERPDRDFTLGMAYAYQNKLDEGLRRMREARERFREEGDIELYDFANKTLMDIYVERKMIDEIASLYPEYVAVSDSLMTEEKANALVTAMVRYDVKMQEDENTILQLKLDAKSRRLWLILVISISVVALLGTVTGVLLVRNRMLYYKRELHRRQMADLQETKNQLSERVDVLEQDISAGMNSNSHILSKPQLITGPEEGKFRRAFNVLYPHFITAIKRDYPKITTNDELLCMLIYLRHTSEEISVYLGISRASVNSARYRLRMKFALPKDVDLDSFIAGREP